MSLIERLDKEIFEQTRNGRNTIYVDVNDLKELGIYIDQKKQGRAFVDLRTLQTAIKRYKFKDGLKVEPEKQETFKEVEQDIKDLEKGEIHKSWDSIEK